MCIPLVFFIHHEGIGIILFLDESKVSPARRRGLIPRAGSDPIWGASSPNNDCSIHKTETRDLTEEEQALYHLNHQAPPSIGKALALLTILAHKCML